jgi:hypothetical protein
MSYEDIFGPYDPHEHVQRLIQQNNELWGIITECQNYSDELMRNGDVELAGKLRRMLLPLDNPEVQANILGNIGEL